jgi:ankyrin repeat protein
MESRQNQIEILAGDGNLTELKRMFDSGYSQLELDVALENAIAYSQIQTAEYLLKLGADFSNYNYQGTYYAVHNNEIEGLKFAIEQGVDVNINDGQLLNTAIVTVFNTKDATTLNYLLEKGADLKFLSKRIMDAFGNKEIKEIIKNATQ